MNPVNSSTLYTAAPKALVEQPRQDELQSKTNASAAYHDKKIIQTDKTHFSASPHFHDQKINERVLQFYKTDEDEKDSDFSEKESEVGQEALHQHQGVGNEAMPLLKVLPCNPFLATSQQSFSSQTASFASHEIVSSTLPAVSLPTDDEAMNTLSSEAMINELLPQKLLSTTAGASSFMTAPSSLPAISTTQSTAITSPSIDNDTTSSDEEDLFSLEVASGQSNKTVASRSEDGIAATVPASSLVSGVVTSQGSNSLSTSGMTQNRLSEPMAATIRLNQFIDELTAAADRVRFNTSSGNDLTINLRSDVLEGTSVRINATPTHIAVSFATSSVESNALLSSNVALLQSHLVLIFPGQSVNVKTDFLTAASSSNFGNEEERSGNDSAGNDKKNKGDL
ncbi:MAG: type III secretion HpaP family protein [Chthoniobacterales bacterium]